MATQAEIEAAAARDPLLAAALSRERGKAAAAAAAVAAMADGPFPEEEEEVQFSPMSHFSMESRPSWGTSWSPHYPIDEELVRESGFRLARLQSDRVERRVSNAARWSAEVELAEAAAAEADQGSPFPRHRQQQIQREWVERRQRPSIATMAVLPREQQRPNRKLPYGSTGPSQKRRSRLGATPLEEAPLVGVPSPHPAAPSSSSTAPLPPAAPHAVPEPTMMAYATWASPAAVGAGHAPPTHAHSRYMNPHALAPLTPEGGLPPAHQQRESARRPRHEPAKKLGPDGKMRLRGVQSLSDISRYTKDIDPYSRHNWEVREAFKAMKREKQAAISASCWGALHKWTAADKVVAPFGGSAARSRSVVLPSGMYAS